MTRNDACPQCDQKALDCDEVDIGVGRMSGPLTCGACHWGEEYGPDDSEEIEAIDSALADSLEPPCK